MRLFVQKDTDGYISVVEGEPGEPYVNISQIPFGGTSCEDHEATVAWHAIMRMRPYAIDHECQLPDHDGEHFHGSALVKTNKGRYFLAANIQTSDDHTDRQCAERSALTESIQNREPDEIVTDIWFTGGMGNFEKETPEPISKGQEGRRAVPCCSCLDALYRENPEMNVHLLPLRPPEKRALMTLQKDPAKGLGDFEYSTEPLRNFYEPQEVILKTAEEKKRYAAVMDFLNDPDDGPKKKYRAAKLANAIGKSRMSNVGREGLLVEVNRKMMTTFREIYRQPTGNLRHIELAIVQTTQGRYFGASSYIDDATTSVPAAVSQAVYSSRNEDPKATIEAVYFMRCDLNELKAMQSVVNFDDIEDIYFATPQGSALERLRKSSEHYKYPDRFSEEECLQGVPIHMIVPNSLMIKDGAGDFKPSRDMVTMHLGDIVKCSWVGSKSVKLRRDNEAGTHQPPEVSHS